MHNTELEHMHNLLLSVHRPEEVFGELRGTQAEMLDAARSIFRQMAKVAHPDHYRQETADFSLADAAFKKLAWFWEQAQRRIEVGVYGTTGTSEHYSLRTSDTSYTIERRLARGEVCDLYLSNATSAGGQAFVILKVPIQPANNDLLLNEARILTRLQTGEAAKKFGHFASQLRETFSYEEAASGAIRQVNALVYTAGLSSLKAVREAYPLGIDPRDMAWIWRRLLVALGFAHMQHIIHGGVLPTHVLLHPEQHGVVLIGWSCSVLKPETTDAYISTISSAYHDWYPAEVFARERPTPGLDIAMAARCMIDLLGGDPCKRTMPTTVPWQIQQHLKGCTLPSARQRPQDVHLLLADFDDLIARLWGPRTFREFRLPG